MRIERMRGEGHRTGKLKQELAQAVLDSDPSMSHKQVSEQLGVPYSTVVGIRTRKSWTHLSRQTALAAE